MELDEKRIALTEQNAKVLLSMLDGRKLKYTVKEQSARRFHVKLHFTGNDLPMTLHIILRTDKQMASVYSALPFKMTQERINDAAIAVAAANHGLVDGSFDLNLSTGEIRFRLTSCYLDAVLSEALFSYLVFVSAETVDRYNDRFEALNNGTMELAAFLAADAADEHPAG